MTVPSLAPSQPSADRQLTDPTLPFRWPALFWNYPEAHVSHLHSTNSDVISKCIFITWEVPMVLRGLCQGPKIKPNTFLSTELQLYWGRYLNLTTPVFLCCSTELPPTQHPPLLPLVIQWFPASSSCFIFVAALSLCDPEKQDSIVVQWYKLQSYISWVQSQGSATLSS